MTLDAQAIVELRFYNVDATPREVVLHVSRQSIEPIMAWYGAYFAGDTYGVKVDGKRVEKDRNGELVTPIIDGAAR